MSDGADYVIDMICVPTGVVCAIQSVPGTLYGNLLTTLGICSTLMVIIVNFDKFIEKIKKYALVIKIWYLIIRDRFDDPRDKH